MNLNYNPRKITFSSSSSSSLSLSLSLCMWKGSYLNRLWQCNFMFWYIHAPGTATCAPLWLVSLLRQCFVPLVNSCDTCSLCIVCFKMCALCILCVWLQMFSVFCLPSDMWSLCILFAWLHVFSVFCLCGYMCSVCVATCVPCVFCLPGYFHCVLCMFGYRCFLCSVCLPDYTCFLYVLFAGVQTFSFLCDCRCSLWCVCLARYVLRVLCVWQHTFSVFCLPAWLHMFSACSVCLATGFLFLLSVICQPC